MGWVVTGVLYAQEQDYWGGVQGNECTGDAGEELQDILRPQQYCM